VNAAIGELQKVAAELGATISFDGQRLIMIIPSSKIKELIFKNADTVIRNVTEIECSDIKVVIDMGKLTSLMLSSMNIATVE